MSEKQHLAVGIRPWTDRDFALLQRLMVESVKSWPEASEEIPARLERYLGDQDTSRRTPMYAIIIGSGSSTQAVGAIGYWPRVLQGEHLWEIGWSVVPEHQGQGIAARALLLVIERARTVGGFRFLHAFPAADNEACNSICREAGFELVEEFDLESLPGHTQRRNNWRLDLFGAIE